jgi:hypothetical protein
MGTYRLANGHPPTQETATVADRPRILSETVADPPRILSETVADHRIVAVRRGTGGAGSSKKVRHSEQV